MQMGFSMILRHLVNLVPGNNEKPSTLRNFSGIFGPNFFQAFPGTCQHLTNSSLCHYYAITYSRHANNTVSITLLVLEE